MSSGRIATSSTALARNGMVCATVVAVQIRPRRRSERASARGRQETLASSGSVGALAPAGALGSGPGSAAALMSPPGDRAAQDHELGVERQLAHLLGVPLALRDDRVVALVELLAERLDRGLGGGAVAGRPLGERRVAGGVHADEPCHGLILRLRARLRKTFRRRAARAGGG